MGFIDIVSVVQVAIFFYYSCSKLLKADLIVSTKAQFSNIILDLDQILSQIYLRNSKIGDLWLRTRIQKILLQEMPI